MEGEAPTTFIPRKILTTDGGPKRRPVNLFFIIALFLLLLSSVGFGGIWFYQRLLTDTINRPCEEVEVGGNTSLRSCGLIASVALEEKSLDRETILLLQRLDKKLSLSNDLAQKHTTFLPVFALLQSLTLPSIQYTRFGFSETGLSLDGRASSYEDIAVQTKVFTQDRTRIKNFIFSDLNLDGQGDVTFRLSMNLESSFRGYVPTRQ